MREIEIKLKVKNLNEIAKRLQEKEVVLSAQYLSMMLFIRVAGVMKNFKVLKKGILS